MQTIDIRIWTLDVWVLCTETHLMHWPFSYIRHNVAILAANQVLIDDFQRSLDYFCDPDDPGACFFEPADTLVLA